ncbi:DUF1129 family protein [Marinilactibacillus kalidii]|uniref:DUF1129 family protein n=1 Tax=Marinilactibacillus kalidii TaxID=2820274 RepID=UPI001ABE1B08|nr:DUF1129 family protein [Marinilactibacillus kalidii]
MNNTKLLIQQNNDLREELNSENKEYYEELLIYLRLKTSLKSEKQMEEILIEILQDLLSAQEENVSAEEYFGKDPKSYADQILSNTSRNWMDQVKLFLYVVVFSVVISSLDHLITKSTIIDLVSLLSRSLFIYLGILIIFKSLETESFKKNASKWRNALFFVFLFSAIFILGVFVEVVGFPFQLLVTVPLWVSWGVSIIVVIVTTWQFFLIPRNEKKYWLLQLLFIWGTVGIGLFHYLN